MKPICVHVHTLVGPDGLVEPRSKQSFAMPFTFGSSVFGGDTAAKLPPCTFRQYCTVAPGFTLRLFRLSTVHCWLGFVWQVLVVRVHALLVVCEKFPCTHSSRFADTPVDPAPPPEMDTVSKYCIIGVSQHSSRMNDTPVIAGVFEVPHLGSGLATIVKA